MSIRYIENKPLDDTIVNKWLGISASHNHWTNFGPLSVELEKSLARELSLTNELRVVVCANATIALHTLVAMYQHLSGKRLKWATSAFGFYSSADGILHDADIIDCDQNAMLDLNQVDLEAIDGLIVTNIFGQEANADIYQEFARKYNKLLIIDSAMGLQPGGHVANECISLHHTKPWGFGEGGCAIVHKDNEALFRSLISFGHDHPNDDINRLAINGKISDIACAYILMRLEQMQAFKSDYLLQYHRILNLGIECGFSVLAQAVSHPGIPANVPLLLPTDGPLIENCGLPVRRYYHPLADRPMASNIYNRIVNIPCHRDMAAYSDDDIVNALKILMVEAHLRQEKEVVNEPQETDRAMQQNTAMTRENICINGSK